MASVIKMGFEGEIYIGTAGSTASTQLGNVRDISISTDQEYGSTTMRGTTGSLPIETEKPTSVKWSSDWNMLEKTDDTELETLKSAAALGTAIALRQKDHSAGKGFDGDVFVSRKQGQPLKGEATHDFTATATNDSATPRAPQLYV